MITINAIIKAYDHSAHGSLLLSQVHVYLRPLDGAVLTLELRNRFSATEEHSSSPQNTNKQVIMLA